MSVVNAVNILERRSPEDTRARILDSAWDLFRELGARATVADFATRLGMSSANIYRFFPSKQALSEAVCDNILRAMLAVSREIATGPGTATERLRAVLLTQHAVMRDQMTNEARAHEIVDAAIAQRWAPVEAFKRDTAALIAELILEGQARGEFGPGNPATLANLTLYACAGLHHPVLIAQNGDAAAEPIVDFALRAIANANPRPPPPP